MGAGEAAADPGQVDDAAAVGELGLGRPALDVVQRPDGHGAVGGEGDALVVELVGDQPPALVLLPDAAARGDADVLVVAGRGVVGGKGVDEGARVTGVGGRDQEHRDALVRGGLRIGAHGEPDPVGGVAVGGPDLLSVDDVGAGFLVARAYGPALERGEVGARVGLAVADGEVDLAGEDSGQEVRLLLVGAELHQGGPDGVQRHQRQRYAGLCGLVEEDELVHRRHAAPAVLLGPADPEPAVGPEPADGLAVEALLGGRVLVAGVDVLRHQLREVGAQLHAQLLLLRRVFEVHGSSGSLAARRRCRWRRAE